MKINPPSPMNDSNQTSTGHHLSGASFLDNHYLAMQEEYESLLRSVGIQPGWKVLDAGCGGGSFLPLLSQLVGPDGSLAAVDLAPENVAGAIERVRAGLLVCPLDARVGSITSLPFRDGTFDAVWSANVSQYLTDDELALALSEFRRVTRAGGLVAVKEGDLLVEQVQPTPPLFYFHLIEAAFNSKDLQTTGMLRPIGFSKWFRAAKLEILQQQSVLIERRAPLRPVERDYIGAVLRDILILAKTLPLQKVEQAAWQELLDETVPDYLLNCPDFCWREGHILVVGRVPKG